jgi:ferredoxin-thioredoxin reductase catalytic subunit
MAVYVEDNFLPEVVLKEMEKYLVNFKEVNTDEKKFWVMDPLEPFVDYVLKKLSLIFKGSEVSNVFCFHRIATDKLDTDWRIHCDSIINDDIPDRAGVIYLSDTELEEMHGTALWEHKVHGEALPWDKLSSSEYNRLLREDANDLSKWNLKSVIGYKKNRFVTYPCNLFHSKYPNYGWKSGRKIFVIFYKVN